MDDLSPKSDKKMTNLYYRTACLYKLCLLVALVFVILWLCASTQDAQTNESESYFDSVPYDNSLFTHDWEPGYLMMSASERARAIIVP